MNVSTHLPDIAVVDESPDRRMWRPNGLVLTVALPWSDYPNGRTVGWCGPAKDGGGWLVSILVGPGAGRYPAATRAAAEHQLNLRTEGLVLR